jgi:hypothetical protein
MEFADGVVMMGRPGPDYRNPRRLRRASRRASTCTRTSRQALPARRGRRGPRSSRSRPTSSTAIRNYAAEDPEGHVWYFAEHTREMTPEDMKKAMSSA